MIHQRIQQTSLLLLICLAASLEGSVAWVASKASAGTSSSSSSLPKTSKKIQIQHTSSSSSSSSTSAKFYKTSASGTEEETAIAAVRSMASPKTPSSSPSSSSSSSSLSKARTLPWMQEDDSDASQSVFLEHWNWQFEFFEEHLTNLRVRTVEHPGDASIHDLYYAIKDESADSHKQQRVYTISLESDEFRDIRMTYMHCPGMQTFRCLSYPRNGDLPICGMGIMKMGGFRNLAILDYQPLPPTNENDVAINDAYTSELLKLRREIPSMGQSMTHRHFDSNEERKYFTEFPLLGRCNEHEATEAEQQTYRTDLFRAQKEYVAKHTELTQAFGNNGRVVAPEQQQHELERKQTLQYVLDRHSDFDTHVCEREPAGPFLCGVFGPEKGGKIVHNVIFPLSRHGLSGHGRTTTTK